MEPQWPGRRVLVGVEGGRPAGPAPDLAELRRLAEGFGSTEVLLDGVLVAVDEGGRPDPDAVDRRLQASGAAARRLATSMPLQLLVLDLLWLDGELLVDQPLQRRRMQLQAVLPSGPLARPTLQADLADAPALLAASCSSGLLGVVAKRLDSRYGSDAGWVAVRA